MTNPPRSSSYDEAKRLARHPDAEVRRKLAAREDVRPEILYYLAGDASAEVRRQIALNAQTPVQADLILARDESEEVRSNLVRKVGRLAPNLSADERRQVQLRVTEVLETLARDQVTRVRQILSETLKDVADAPRSVIKHLSRDAALEVAAPVLQFSPLLTDEDLLEIIGASPSSGALGAISRRAGLGGQVSDAIVATEDVPAVAVLLANSSAQIREETLDFIIDKANAVEAWHAPLVHRPQLPAAAAKRLASFVAENLIEHLKKHPDLDSTTVSEIASEMRRRLAADGELRWAKTSAAPAATAESAEVARRPGRESPELDAPRPTNKAPANGPKSEEEWDAIESPSPAGPDTGADKSEPDWAAAGSNQVQHLSPDGRRNPALPDEPGSAEAGLPSRRKPGDVSQAPGAGTSRPSAPQVPTKPKVTPLDDDEPAWAATQPSGSRAAPGPRDDDEDTGWVASTPKKTVFDDEDDVIEETPLERARALQVAGKLTEDAVLASPAAATACLSTRRWPCAPTCRPPS
ncbi:MAG: DUF2336 domain-containing protein [Rhodospirillaceae bacterium]|nr:DUF2336 domain-containing protein [Rhodospirillaceae bacterium]